MTPTIAIRPREEADLPALAQVLIRVHELDGYPIQGVADPIGWLRVKRAIACWTVTVDGQPVGHVALTQAATEDDAAKVWVNHTSGNIADLTIPVRLFVDPDHRNLGLGRELMEAVGARAKVLGKDLALDVIEKDRAARRLYSKMGYVPIGEVNHKSAQTDLLALIFLRRHIGYVASGQPIGTQAGPDILNS